MKDIAGLVMRFGKGANQLPVIRLRLWPKTRIDPAWLILSASCRLTIKTSTAGVRSDRVGP
jgi:hypothetical protein